MNLVWGLRKSGGLFTGAPGSGDLEAGDLPERQPEQAKGLKRKKLPMGASAQAVRFEKYDPDQPRDEDGKWTGGGGSGSFDEEAFADTTTRDEALAALKSSGAEKIDLSWAGDALKGTQVYANDGKVLEVTDSGGEVFDSVGEWATMRADAVGEAMDEQFNAEFWDKTGSQPTLYHATTDENVSSVKTHGLMASELTRGMSNKGIGKAVFTTDNLEEINDGTYGNNVFEIDTAALARDLASEGRPFPFVTREPDIQRYEAAMALARAAGDDAAADTFEPENSVFEGTHIFHGFDIPAKYLKLVQTSAST